MAWKNPCFSVLCKLCNRITRLKSSPWMTGGASSSSNQPSPLAFRSDWAKVFFGLKGFSVSLRQRPKRQRVVLAARRPTPGSFPSAASVPFEGLWCSEDALNRFVEDQSLGRVQLTRSRCGLFGFGLPSAGHTTDPAACSCEPQSWDQKPSSLPPAGREAMQTGLSTAG